MEEARDQAERSKQVKRTKPSPALNIFFAFFATTPVTALRPAHWLLNSNPGGFKDKLPPRAIPLFSSTILNPSPSRRRPAHPRTLAHMAQLSPSTQRPTSLPRRPASAPIVCLLAPSRLNKTSHRTLATLPLRALCQSQPELSRSFTLSSSVCFSFSATSSPPPSGTSPKAAAAAYRPLAPLASSCFFYYSWHWASLKLPILPRPPPPQRTPSTMPAFIFNPTAPPTDISTSSRTIPQDSHLRGKHSSRGRPPRSLKRLTTRQQLRRAPPQVLNGVRIPVQTVSSPTMRLTSSQAQCAVATSAWQWAAEQQSPL